MNLLIQYALGSRGIRTDDDAIETGMRGERANDWATAAQLTCNCEMIGH